MGTGEGSVDLVAARIGGEVRWMCPAVRRSPGEKFEGDEGEEVGSASRFLAEDACEARAGTSWGIIICFSVGPGLVAVQVQGLQFMAVRAMFWPVDFVAEAIGTICWSAAR